MKKANPVAISLLWINNKNENDNVDENYNIGDNMDKKKH
jgi:hypothetical protein